MTGVLLKNDARRVACSIALVARGHKFVHAGNTKQAQQSEVRCCAQRRSVSCGQEPVATQQICANTSQWWDGRWSNSIPGHPNCGHRDPNYRWKTTVGTGAGTAQWSGAFVADKGNLEFGKCRELCESGVVSDAVCALDQLVQGGCHVPRNLFHRVIKRCTLSKELGLGRHIHALTVSCGYEGDAFLATHLIGLYASLGRMDEAMAVFSKVPSPDAYNWASIIFAYAKQGGAAEAAEAVRLYRQMCQSSAVQPDDRLYSAVLKACAAVQDVVAGKEVHARIVASQGKPDRFVQAGLVNMYAKCGSLEDARKLFDTLSDKDVVTWTSMIAGYTQQKMGLEAVNLYRRMQQEGVSRPNSFTYACLLQACGSIGVGALNEGKQLHSEIKARGLEEDAVLAVSLVHMYAKCGGMEDARRLFENLSSRDAATWAMMIAGYVQQGTGQQALGLYRRMQHAGLTPNSATYGCLLQALASVGARALVEGRELHAEIRERGLQDDVVLGGSLVNMYVKCGSLRDARSLFDKLSNRNVVAWTAMIAGYAQLGMGLEALNLYNSMLKEGLISDAVTYVCLLQACASVGVGALHEGMLLHVQIEKRGLEEDAVLGGSLVNMYAKCGSLEDARKLFDKLSNKNVVAWNAMITGYAQQGMNEEVLGLYSSMQQEGVIPDVVTYACMLQAYASVGVGALQDGKTMHVNIEERGLEENSVLGGSLVNMYVKCGSLEDARRLFNKLPHRNILAWNAMIKGYVQQGMGEEALRFYKSMLQYEGPSPNAATYVCLLQECARVGVGALSQGKQLHALIEERGLEVDSILGGSLVDMYAKCGSLEDARKLFDKLLQKNVVAWTAMIAGYAKQGMGQEALNLYKNMRHRDLHPDSVTYVCLLQACARVGVGALREGRNVHFQIEEQGLEEDVVLGGSLVHMYAKCGSLGDGRKLFDKLPSRNIVAWNTMIAGYAQQGMGGEALSLYKSMQEKGITPDSVTYISLLQACASVGVGVLEEGKRLHVQIGERGLQEDATVVGSLVNMYAKCGSLEDARRLFDELPDKDVVAWNAMIAGYIHQGMGREALSLHKRMQLEGTTPNSVTYVCLLQACASMGAGVLQEGEQLHAQMEEQGLKEDAVLAGSLMNMYAKCGGIKAARRLFDKLPDRSTVAWNTMIAGYAQQGLGEEALRLYSSMRQEGLVPDSVTYVALLQACAAVAALPLGEQLHGEIEDKGMQADSIVGAALVNMYAKCGSICDSQGVFDSLSERSIEAWNALVGGYARQGQSQVVFALLARMRLEGIHPNEITFLSILSVCSHAGLVDEGREYFKVMIADYGLSATMKHYICMVDLLGRAGHLHDALQTARSMPFPPNTGVWHALLSACRKWKNVEIGQQAFKGAVSVDEKDAAAYLLMSNIYASNQMWEAAKEMKEMRMKLGAWKKPGQSWWTDMDGVVHTFYSRNDKYTDIDISESESIDLQAAAAISEDNEENNFVAL